MQYSSQDKLCILLSHLFVGASLKCVAIAQKYGDIENLTAKINTDKRHLVSILGEENFDILHAALASNKVEKFISNCEKFGIVCVSYFSDQYSNLLTQIYDPPVNLFCMGNTELLNTRSLAIIGTRKVSRYGKDVTTKFASTLSYFFTIVSGLAIGIDSIAHETTLNEKGKTIAVLGGGLDRIYPALNEGLFRRIIQNDGLVMSEYPLGTEPKHYFFPQRNRIVAGLCKGVLVCQAPMKSGTFGTVNFAIEENREVFAVPGEIFDHGFLGSNDLIKSVQGAMVTSPSDILSRFQINQTVQEKIEIELDTEEQQVVDLLKLGRRHFNDLIMSTKFSAVQLNIIISNLELKGIVLKLAGNHIQLTGNSI